MKIVLTLIISLAIVYFLFLSNSSKLNTNRKSLQESKKEIDKQTSEIYSEGQIDDTTKNSMDDTEKQVFDETGYRRMSKDEVEKQQNLLKGLLKKK